MRRRISAQAPEDVEAAWSEEIQRRLAEVDAGEVKTIPWSEARRRIFAIIEPSPQRQKLRLPCLRARITHVRGRLEGLRRFDQ